MIDYLLAIIIGVVSGLVASGIFLQFLTRIKPKIVISDKIAKVKTSTVEIVYLIKIINKTRRPIIKVKAQLLLITHTMTHGGILENVKKFNLKEAK